jgi:DNA-binding beta-propeller fold protein YncE
MTGKIRNLLFNISELFKRTLVIFILLVLWLLSPLMGQNAHAIKLTYIKHIFDITHNFSQPSDVSVSGNGLIYVVDGVNNKIQVFNHRGKFIFSFGRKGSLKGQFENPLGIDIDDSGRVYVADSGNHRVQIFNSKGTFISQIRIPRRGENPADPTDIAVNESKGRCYVADNNNHYILVYDLSTLKLIDTFGSGGMEKLEFRYPFLMTLDMDEYLYIVDVINTRVQVLTPAGKFVNYIGGWGVEKGEFFRPKGVAVDRDNRIFVSDSYLGVIQVFEPDGDFLSAIGNPQNKAVSKFNTPTGVFIDDYNRLYVVEMFADKISVYSLGEDSE